MTAPLTAGMTGPETTAAEQSRMELQAKLNGLGGLHGRQVSPEAKAKKLREACEGFESIFIQKMWQEMRNTVPKGGLLQGKEERFWQDMYDQELSKSMTSAGGIGLADMMYEQLSRNLVSASRSAAGSVTGAAFTPSAAPLVVDSNAEDLIGGTLQADAGNIYDSEAPATAPVTAASAQPAPKEPETAPQTPAQPVEVHYSPAANTAHNTAEPHKRAADLGQANGLAMAQKARRDAGDKLGSRAVRPPQPGQKIKAAPQRVEKPEQGQAAAVAATPGSITQAGLQPGSPEALRAAMELAKTGAAGAEQSEAQAAINLHNLVANVQARNAQSAMASQVNQTSQNNAQEVAEAAPTMRRVRKTTNIPQRGKSKTPPKQSDAIRMLNVDNVGVNSRAGQGLKAYHAQQEAAAQAAQTSQPAANAPVPPAGAGNEQTGIAPLRAAGQAAEAAPQAGSFAIPPLTASQSRG